ncbi:MAG: Crp/Fnr family transcriptional regulator [Clostridia bacterium]|nr:Crp/Fnr family transcriptional regulator [Clostridia bacterium]
MQKYFTALRNCSLFSDISDADLLSMLTCLGASLQTAEKNETLLSEGESADRIGILLSGEAQIVQIDYYGNRSIHARVAPTEVFGESFAFAGIDALPVDIVSTERSEVLWIEANRVTHTCSNACEFHNRIIYNLMRILAEKNLVFHKKIEITAQRSTREKLMAYLLSEAKRQNSNRFEIPYDRQELADYLEVDRSGLSAEIGKLQRNGVIWSNKNQFALL